MSAVSNSSMSAEVLLPLPKVAGANSRCHWVVRSKAASADRATSSSAGKGLLRRPLPKAGLRIDWYCPTKRLIDCDNALSRCKSYIDGLTDAAWWVDDKAVRTMTITVHPPDGKMRGVVVIQAYPM